MNELLQAIILGAVEGATEFIPVSSTGHLILAGHLIGFTGTRAALFEVFIQLGAILAVVWNYRGMLTRWVHQAIVPQEETARARHLFLALLVAFLPAAIVGLGVHRWVTAHLFTPAVVAAALVLGGVAILFIERFRPAPRIDAVTSTPLRIALGIGIAQALSLIPGVSRAAATIMGGVVLGLSRPAATEFSFFLAIPVMFAATGLAGVESVSLLHRGDVLVFALGFITAFVTALIAIRALLRFVSHHTFVAFAWYRIVLGGVVFVVLHGTMS